MFTHTDDQAITPDGSPIVAPASLRLEATPTSGNSSQSGSPPSAKPSRSLSWRQSASGANVHASEPTSDLRSAIEFRVFRTGSPVRRLRLSGPRYTFGSGEHCSIRLSDTALRPMHAVLIRDAERVRVRAYSVPIEINSTQITEATLVPGDVMRLGQYRFELLPAAMCSSASSSPIEPVETAARDCRAETGRLSFADVAPFTAHVSIFSDPSSFAGPASSSDESEQWRQQLRREVDQWRARETEADHRDRRCDERESALRGRESELWQRAEMLQRREHELKEQELAAREIQQQFKDKQATLSRLQEENRQRVEAFQRREDEFDRLEQEYQRQVAEAGRQLQQSQTQAETASQAVTGMRKQFELLNQQLEELSQQQQQLEQQEQQRLQEHQRACRELEQARDQALSQRDLANQERDAAIDSQAQSEAKRQDADARLCELTALLDQTRSEQESEQKQIAAGERIAEQLRGQVEELQAAVKRARNEAAKLRQDYEQACQSIRQLEAITEQTRSKSDKDRESWAAEAEQLRQSVQQLSQDLSNANSELGTLRETNGRLASQLDQTTGKLDEAIQQRDAANAQLVQHPGEEAWQNLHHELANANEELSGLRSEYATTLKRLEEARAAAEEAKAVAQEARETAEQHAAKENAAVARADREQQARETAERLAEESRQLAAEAEQIARDKAAAEESLRATEQARHEAEQARIDAEEAQREALQARVEAEQAQRLAECYAAEKENEAQQAIEERLALQQQLEDARRDAAPMASVETDAPLSQTMPIEDELAAESELAAEDERAVADAWAITSGSSEDGEVLRRWDETSELAPDTQSGSELSTDTQMDSVDFASNEQQEDEPFLDGSFSGGHTDLHAASGDTIHDAQPAADAADDDAWPTYRTHEEPSDDWNSQSVAYDCDSQPAGWEDESSVDESNSADWASDPPEETDESSAGEYQAEITPEPTDDHWQTGLAEGSLASRLIEDIGTDTGHPPQDESAADPTHENLECTSQWGGAFDQVEAATELELGSQSETASEPQVDEDDCDSPADMTQNLAGFAGHDDQMLPNESSPIASSQTEAPSTQAPNDSAESFATPASHEADPEDDSIEAYMNRLLQRVQGGTSASQTSTGVPTSVATPTATTPPLSEEAPAEIAEPETPEEPIDPDAPLVPRSQAPERNSNLTAMRELANATARSAITHSVKIQTRNTQLRAVTKFGQAGIAVVTGLAAILLITGVIKYVATMAAMTVAGIFVSEGLKLLSDARRRMAWADSGRAEELIAEDEAAKAELPASDED